MCNIQTDKERIDTLINDSCAELIVSLIERQRITDLHRLYKSVKELIDKRNNIKEDL